MSNFYQNSDKARAAIAPREAPEPVNELRVLIKKFSGEIKLALPKFMDSDRMTRIIMSEVTKTPKLATCDRGSFFGAMLECCQLGLEPGAGLGHIHLIPYKGKAKIIIGYQGMVELAERSGKVTIDADVVYERDEFDYCRGLSPNITHRPFYGGEDPGPIIGAYAIARYADGRGKFRFISRIEIDEARKRAQTDHVWSAFFSEMARKTAIRRLFKIIPKSPEMARVQELEDAEDADDPQNLEYKEPILIPDEIISSSESDN